VSAAHRQIWFWCWAGLATSFGSFGPIQKAWGYLSGLPASGAALALSLALYAGSVAWVGRTLMRATVGRGGHFSDRFGLGTTALLAAIGLLFLVTFPIVNSGVFGGGSDRDEALNIAVTALLEGRYPYAEVTIMTGLPQQVGLDGNPISPLPGALLLAAPFVLLGNSAYQNLFFAGFCAWIAWRAFGSTRRAFAMTAVSLVGVIGSLYETMSGGDYLVGGMWLFCVVCPLLCTELSTRTLLLLAAFVGLALSSRMSMGLIAPLLGGAVLQRYGARAAATCSVVAGACFLVVTLPFWLYDPAAFSPLHTLSKLEGLEGVLPGVTLAVPLGLGVIAVALAVDLARRRATESCWALSMAAILAAPFFITTVLAIVQTESIGFLPFSQYALVAVHVGVLAMALRADETARQGGAPGHATGQ
jgi:hypothetical protein